ncbi:MAG: DUF2520 domain-containing protein [Dehalococcoidia bacterium]|nr:DUF2520 domain-containing protein [Dehalococcoidia bacterium]
MLPTDDVSIGFVGAGTLGRGLALALDGVGRDVAAVSSRTRASADWLAERIDGCTALDTAQDVAHACDLVFITTPDAVIADVAATVNWRPVQGVVHCCGAASTELLTPAADAGAEVGAMHPFQTFAVLSEPPEAARRLSGVTFAVSATGWLADYLPSLAESLGGSAVTIPDELRPLYHASAVLSCGYVATLLDAAVNLWTTMGFSAEDGIRAAMPLARATIEAIAAAGPADAVTGPAVRGDAATISAHLEVLSRHAENLLPLYRELTLASLPLARGKGVPEADLARLRRTAGGAG